MLRNLLRRSPANRLIAGTPHVGLLASQIISETAAGDQGAGLLYDEALAQTGKQLRVKVTSWNGTAGTLFVYENGSVLVEGQADGSYVIGYDWEAWAANGTLTTGSDTASVQIGPLSASASGAIVVGAGSVSGGTATGQSNATASGTTVTGTGSVSGGSASGEQNATAAGAVVTGAGSVYGGAATGGASGDGFASGATVTGSGSVVAGSATGEQNVTAPGATVTGAGSVAGGAASSGGSLSGSLSDDDIARIAAAVLAALNATTIPVDVRKVNGDTIIGHGIPPTYDNTGAMTDPGNPWRPQ